MDDILRQNDLSIEWFSGKTIDDVMKWRGIGRKGAEYIRERLREKGLSLSIEAPQNWPDCLSCALANELFYAGLMQKQDAEKAFRSGVMAKWRVKLRKELASYFLPNDRDDPRGATLNPPANGWPALGPSNC